MMDQGIIEALEAHTEDEQRHLDRIAVMEICEDATKVMPTYGRLHREYPSRELYFVHTAREQLDIRDRRGTWVPRRYAVNVKR